MRRGRDGRRARTRSAGRRRRLDGRSAVVGRSVLRRVRWATAATTSSTTRSSLDYDPATQVLDGKAHDHARADAGPRPVQPRPARLVRRLAGGGRQAPGRVLPGGRPGARDHAAAEAARRSHVHGRGRLPGRAGGRHRPGRELRGLGQEPDGAFVVNEPQGSPGWFPVNDDPNDKATYDFAITVPEGNVALGNGRLLSSVTDGGKTTWRWREDSPMASYLTTATNGDFDLTIDTGPNGLPIYNAIDSKGDSARHGRLQRGAEGDRGPALRRPAADPPGAHRPLGPVPVHERRRGDRPRPRRLRARVADEADVRRRARPEHGRARARAPVVRRQRDAVGVAGHLARRGLRALLGVDVQRAHGRPDGAGSSSTPPTPPPATSSIWKIAPRAIPGAGEPVRRRSCPTTAAR